MKSYILKGFATKDAALDRSRKIAFEQGIMPNEITKYWFKAAQLTQTTTEEWALIIPEEQKHVLAQGEIKQLLELPQQKFCNLKLPIVYRYLEREYVDKFFDEGVLRLSSFFCFKKHQDEQRGDNNEGNNILESYSEKHTMFAVTSHGSNAYVLATSLLADKSLGESFNCDDYFKILQPERFALTITEKLGGSRGVLIMPCIYQEQRIIRRKMGMDLDNFRIDDDPKKLNLGKLHKYIQNIGQEDVFFIKLNKYKHQYEYRFVWIQDDKVEDNIDVYCPEALEFCERNIVGAL